MYEIISNDHLKLENEDTLFEFIEELLEISSNEETSGKNIFEELMYINNLSEEAIIKFILNLGRNEITNELWNKLVKRFIHQHDPNNDENKIKNEKERKFKKDNQNSMSGIVTFLTKEAGGNVHDKGTVSVTDTLAKYAVDLNEIETRFISQNFEDSS